MAILNDVKLALRQLRRAPAYSLVTVLTLALGIGVNVAIFGLLYSVQLRALPSPDSDHLARVLPGTFVTGQHLDVLRDELEATGDSAFDALSVAASGQVVLTGAGAPAMLPATVVDGSHFDAFGIEASSRSASDSGRHFAFFRARGGFDVGALAESLCQATRRFSEERSTCLAKVRTRRTIVGVLPKDYEIFPWQSELLVPFVRDTASHEWRDMARYWLIGRLSESADLESASRAAVTAVTAAHQRPEAFFDEELSREARAVGYLESWVGPSGQRLRLLLLAVLAVLLVACANVSHLASTRLMGRGRELAIRSALGAERFALVRQLLIESAVLALLGGLLGAVAGVVALRLTVASGVLDGVLARHR